ncbi:DNA polymerase [Candidatus Macondimonas diazotrophica]|jgi:DNA polymerase-1|uniref:DNA-directed DNA polymerase n=1 Tax=Candidatus Macondimonas diazotrophica TaxID=2305248 RepID=A0A4Z0F7K4_9GAMM|nr:DNA polymerase [Candidatus Macondimonas diazotrophica]TFZ81432.1 hypothetical protein E4680_12515 [Candidatus Macondimonas diazotrophica]
MYGFENLTKKELKDVKVLLEALIDNSYSSIIKNNFIAGFDKFTVDGRLFGNVSLFGAKSFRLTSNSPNLLNQPSTGSIYAKAVKDCFTAPKGRIIYSADLTALEDKGMANLSKDENKVALFLENLDGHSLSACYYFKPLVEELIGEFDDPKEASKLLKDLVDKEDEEAEKLRQSAKRPSFGLGYGQFPPGLSKALKCSLSEAEELFDMYHNELYPGVTKYREEYVLKTAKENGYVHLGLGCRIYSDNPESDIRTLVNATIQFWSILSLIAVNEINYRGEKEGMSDRFDIQATIYDSIYLEVDKDPEVVKWVNDNVIETLCTPYLKDQIVSNSAKAAIGNNWNCETKIPNESSTDEIKLLLENIK